MGTQRESCAQLLLLLLLPFYTWSLYTKETNLWKGRPGWAGRDGLRPSVEDCSILDFIEPRWHERGLQLGGQVTIYLYTLCSLYLYDHRHLVGQGLPGRCRRHVIFAGEGMSSSNLLCESQRHSHSAAEKNLAKGSRQKRKKQKLEIDKRDKKGTGGMRVVVQRQTCGDLAATCLPNRG